MKRDTSDFWLARFFFNNVTYGIKQVLKEIYDKPLKYVFNCAREILQWRFPTDGVFVYLKLCVLADRFGVWFACTFLFCQERN